MGDIVIMKTLTIIVPCFNEEKAIPYFHAEILKVWDQIKGMERELLFIDDGSSDRTLEVIKELQEKDGSVHFISFSRNFGKEGAIYAGLQNATGDYVAIMDADLQDPPALLPEMLQAVLEENYDCVGTRRVTRKGEPPVRSFFARSFYKLINCISKTKLVDGARDYRLMSRQVVQSLLDMPEYNRFSKGLFEWVGYRTKWLEYENIERVAGETKWSFWKLFLYSLEGIIAFSTVPLALASLMGGIFCLLSGFGIAFLIIRQLIWHDSVPGWTSLATLIVFVFGVQLLCLGIIGQYIAKMYYETKRRPIYIAREQA